MLDRLAEPMKITITVDAGLVHCSLRDVVAHQVFQLSGIERFHLEF